MSCRLLHRGVRGAGVARYLLPRLQLFMYEKGTPRIRLVPELRVKAAQHLRLRDGEGFGLCLVVKKFSPNFTIHLSH